MIYKFDQFNVEITNPIIQVNYVTDDIQNKQCNVEVMLTTWDATFNVTLLGFTYTSDWNDSEVEAWTLTELEKYAV